MTGKYLTGTRAHQEAVARADLGYYLYGRGSQGAEPMLPPIIIDQIKKREEEERRRRQQPFIQLPVPQPASRPRLPDSDEPERGVVIIDIT
jgi:hypothetical protein